MGPFGVKVHKDWTVVRHGQYESLLSYEVRSPIYSDVPLIKSTNWQTQLREMSRVDMVCCVPDDLYIPDTTTFPNMVSIEITGIREGKLNCTNINGWCIIGGCACFHGGVKHIGLPKPGHNRIMIPATMSEKSILEGVLEAINKKNNLYRPVLIV